MAMTESGVAAAFLPNGIGPLIVQPVVSLSVAFRVATVFQTGQAAGLRIPTGSAAPAPARTPRFSRLRVTRPSRRDG